MLSKRLKSNNLTICPPTAYSKLTICDHMGENDQIFAKAFSTNNGLKFKVIGVLESSIFTLKNEILRLSTGHDKDPLSLLTLRPFLAKNSPDLPLG